MIIQIGCKKKPKKNIKNYKVLEKNNDLFFKYNPPKKNKKIFLKKPNKESPFMVLKNLNLN